MGKMTTFVLLISLLVLCSYLFGITTPQGTLLGILLNPQLLTSGNSLLAQVVIAISAVFVVAGAVVAFVNRNFELAAVGPMAIFLISLFGDLIVVFNSVQALNRPIALIFFGPIMVLYVITVLDWWRGRD